SVGGTLHMTYPIREQVRIKDVRLSAVGVKLQGALKLVFGSAPVPVPEGNEAELGMAGRERVINFDCLLCRRFRFWEKFGCRQIGRERREVSVGEPRIGERVRR